MKEKDAFKVCTSCGFVWYDRDEFLRDPSLRLEGYQVNFADLEAGLFLFTHNIPACGSTIAIEAGKFTDLHKGQIFEDRLLGTPHCDGSCLHDGVIDSCKEKCECAYVRDVLKKVSAWPKYQRKVS